MIMTVDTLETIFCTLREDIVNNEGLEELGYPHPRPDELHKNINKYAEETIIIASQILTGDTP